MFSCFISVTVFNIVSPITVNSLPISKNLDDYLPLDFLSNKIESHLSSAALLLFPRIINF